VYLQIQTTVNLMDKECVIGEINHLAITNGSVYKVEHLPPVLVLITTIQLAMKEVSMAIR